MTTTGNNNDTFIVSQNNEQNSVLGNNQPQDDEEKGPPELEIQETVNDDDIIGLEVETWDDEEKDKPRRRSWDRSRGRERRNSRDREREKERDRERDRDNGRSRRRSRSTERRRELARRDPCKSNKDIEQDKMRTKKDIDSKILAEKEKAIKNLLDSDNVVPPGTEGEAIQIIVDKTQQQEDESRKSKKNSRERDTRKRSPVRNRLGYVYKHRGKTPIEYTSPERIGRRRSPDDRRRRSYDRETSLERREASKRRLRERDTKYGRRSRSRDRRSSDRHRSRSLERHRRLSRSPYDRRSPRRMRRRSLSRTPLRSPTRTRRRSPFLNEIARQLQGDSLRSDNSLPAMQQQLGPMHGMGPGGPPPFMPPGGGPPGLHPGPMMPGGPPGLLPTPGMMPVMPPGLGGPMDMHHGPLSMHPGPVMHPGPPGMPGPSGVGPPYIGYDGCPPGPPAINYDPLNRGHPPPDYSSAPVLYNQANSMPPMNSIPHPMQSLSPKPVPAPGQGPPLMFSGQSGPPGSAAHPDTVPGPMYSPNQSRSPQHRIAKRADRMKTPEPPIISDFKQNGKTSLSSLLEASVSTKDSSSLTASYKGFKPEVIRHCERALRSLPAEDPRLKMKGRFFFDPAKKAIKKDTKETTSNSILLRRGRTEIHWDEEENQLTASTQEKLPIERKRVVTHQKICQTDEVTKESSATQVELTTSDFAMQVYPQDLQPPPAPKEDRRPQLEDRRPQLDDRRPQLEERRPQMEDRRPQMDERRQQLDDRRPQMDDRRPQMDDRRLGLDDRRPQLDERRPQLDDRRLGLDDRRPQLDDRRPLADRLDWSMRETFDHSAKLRDKEDLRWSLTNSSVRERPANPWSTGFSPSRQPIISDHLHGGGASLTITSLDGIKRVVGLDNMSRNAGLDMRGSLEMMRDRGNLDRSLDGRDRGLDARDRGLDNRDRVMDIRDRDLDMRDRDMDMRDRDIDFRDPMGLDMMRDRDRIMDRGGILDVGTRGLDSRRELADDYSSHSRDHMPIDDYDQRKPFGGGFNRNMEMMDRERSDMSGPLQGDSPVMLDDDDPEELEIIEERVLDREKPSWQQRNSKALSQFNNARGGAGARGAASKRVFRGRIGPFRNF